MTRILIPTVQHTGTLFLRGLFERAGFEPADFEHPPTRDRAVLCDHVDDLTFRFLKPLLGRHPVVVPLRHPYRVAASWVGRKEPLRRMVRQWNLMRTWVAPFSPVWVPIDNPEQYPYSLQTIKSRFGIELSYDQTPVNVRVKSYELSPEQIDLDPVLKEFFRVPFFSRFYPDLEG